MSKDFVVRIILSVIKQMMGKFVDFIFVKQSQRGRDFKYYKKQCCLVPGNLRLVQTQSTAMFEHYRNYRGNGVLQSGFPVHFYAVF